MAKWKMKYNIDPQTTLKMSLKLILSANFLLTYENAHRDIGCIKSPSHHLFRIFILLAKCNSCVISFIEPEYWMFYTQTSKCMSCRQLCAARACSASFLSKTLNFYMSWCCLCETFTQERLFSFKDVYFILI